MSSTVVFLLLWARLAFNFQMNKPAEQSDLSENSRIKSLPVKVDWKNLTARVQKHVRQDFHGAACTRKKRTSSFIQSAQFPFTFKDKVYLHL